MENTEDFQPVKTKNRKRQLKNDSDVQMDNTEVNKDKMEIDASGRPNFPPVKRGKLMVGIVGVKTRNLFPKQIIPVDSKF